MLDKISMRPQVPFVFKSDNSSPLSREGVDSSEIMGEHLNGAPNAYYSKITVEKVKPPMIYEKHSQNNYQGCLLGGAIGDALGWPVEFRHLSEIRSSYGSKGITDLELKAGKAEITDDTQMTIYTADGLLKSAVGNFDEDAVPDMDIVYDSYQDWLKTQYDAKPTPDKGWISNIEELYKRRAPGNTCIGSLCANVAGSIEEPVNESKGCGGVMRVAPVGLMYYKNPELAFEVGARCAALTHGSPSSYLPAGVHACIIANIVQGKNINDAVDNAIETLKNYEGNEATLYLLEAAKLYVEAGIDSDIAIRSLGEGWHGDEAIAIAVYCILKSPNDFKNALILAVNHSGDSDSTGSIVGNILGAYLGSEAIPSDWKNNVELSNELIQLAQDLYVNPKEIESADTRYVCV